MKLETQGISSNIDYVAPDGSEIRLLPNVRGGGLCHCTLPSGGVSSAVTHATVDEIWYFLEGEGEVWRKLGEEEAIVEVSPGFCVTLPVGTHFQFRNTGAKPLCFIIATMPKWPGPQEAVRVSDYWPTQALEKANK